MDLGRCYNAFMELLPTDDDWACFIDHDAMFTTRDWYAQLTRVVTRHSDAGCFTAMTNRISNRAQVYGATRYGRASPNANHDIRYHRRIGARLEKQFGSEVVPLTDRQMMSGVVILTRKSVWRQIGFAPGFLGVDWQYHRDCLRLGYTVYLMRGVYVYHWYRGDGDVSHVRSARARG
jgi:GT2 family glycosyltransferase